MTRAPHVAVRAVEVAAVDCRMRLPFRFGGVTVTEAPLLHVAVTLEVDVSKTATGMAADLLVPRWFRKDVDRDHDGDQQALSQSVVTAANCVRTMPAATALELWQKVQHNRVEREPPDVPDLLERGFGIAIVERAMLDAICRACELDFATALTSGVFGRVFADRGRSPRRILVRHTVGRLDPLRTGEIPAAERLDDGQPEALDEVLRQHGVRWLKVKIGAGATADVARLEAIAELLRELELDEVRLTLDGNEQYPDIAELDRFWRGLAASPTGRELLPRIAWIEQPLPRHASLQRPPESDWPRERPLLLDEADAQRRTFRESGYDGVSVKNCKGVFRALLNGEYCADHEGRFQSSEDLTNQPVLSVQQDLVTAAVLDLPHTERNGQHYVGGLDHLPAPVVDRAMTEHRDLYERTAAGGARLRIENGELRFDSLFGPGYGAAQPVVDALRDYLEWQPI